jgi:hypothetical protein
MRGWIAVDLDGTLAQYDGWRGEAHIGDPVGPMVDRVRAWLAAGHDVRIFTARVARSHGTNDAGDVDDDAFAARQIARIEAWCNRHLGVVLPITATKDLAMICLYDDRCVQVETNTGQLIERAVPVSEGDS